MNDDIFDAIVRGYAQPRMASACARGGCQSARLLAMLEAAATQIGEMIAREEQRMKSTEPAKALWCETGDHAFSERAPGWKVLVISGGDEEDNESLTVCGPHLATHPLGQHLHRAVTAAPAPAPAPGFTPAPPATDTTDARWPDGSRY